MTDTPTTNINPGIQDAFHVVTSGQYKNIALFSCFVNDEPAAAIVAITDKGNDDVIITPLFVSVTPSMVLTDHDGNPA